MTFARSAESLRAARAAVGRARRTGRAQWLAVRAADEPGRDPLAVFEGLGDDDRFCWHDATSRTSLVASGSIAAVEAAGRDRFARASEAARALFADGGAVGGDPELPGPLLVGGFAFDDDGPRDPEWAGFGAARLVLPEWLHVEIDGRAQWVAARSVRAGDDPHEVASDLAARLARARSSSLGRVPARRAAPEPDYRSVAERPHSVFRTQVRRALSAIAAGELEKVVVARALRVDLPPGFDPGGWLDSLRREQPSSLLFAVARRDACFLGATPERLVRLCATTGRLETGALAGSAPRGRTPEEDARLARALRESKKEQAEHAAVVRAIRDGLRPLCGELEGPEAPQRLALDGIQHLHTPLVGRLRDGLRESVTVVDLAGALHPTPAVGGSPTAAAREWLRRHEDLDRGWYAAPIGFVGPDGSGEFRVALRCALQRGGSARLFAGAGVVAGSDPDAELRETRLKLRTLLAPLLEV